MRTGCTWEGTRCGNASWGLALLKRLWKSLCWTVASGLPWQLRMLTASRAIVGKELSPFIWHLLAYIQILCLVLGLPVQERYWQTGATSAEGLQEGGGLQHSPVRWDWGNWWCFSYLSFPFWIKVRATARNATPAQSPARGSSFLPCPFSGPNSLCSGSTSFSFQGPPNHCHLICRLLAHCWQWPGPLPHPEQEEQHLLPLDCCLVLPPDLYICVCACLCAAARGGALWRGGHLSDAWKAVLLAAEVPPSL